MRKILFLTIISLIEFSSFAQTPAQLAQQQLDAYNNKDIEAFLAPYSENVKIYNHPNELTMSGKEAMRQRYGNMFANTPDLHCTLMNRMVLGNTVIDQEFVIRDKTSPPTEVIAIYKIEGGKIAEVYFIRPKL
jgi:hypothetical protein